jgi:hypothetical protein
MTYVEIIEALPKSIVLELQENLDSIELSSKMSSDEVAELIYEAVKLTRVGDAYLAELDIEKRRMIDALLGLIPWAGARALAG